MKGIVGKVDSGKTRATASGQSVKTKAVRRKKLVAGLNRNAIGNGNNNSENKVTAINTQANVEATGTEITDHNDEPELLVKSKKSNKK